VYGASCDKRHSDTAFRLGLLLLSLISVAARAALCEFPHEGMVPMAFGSSYDGKYEDADRRRFIMTSTGFATISPVIPGLLVSLCNCYPEITDARLEALRLA